ncbi:nucleotidyltransferase [Wenzhouxiangella sp. AB-CW3]|uniref:nucleotidyltransferase n=1 Tax=Wenzhouxiangella sp. AB-CW3 TaxID=2771012 RepID=UPI00168B663C|nr:nucleotidyltransferase [Wenzhouxiangella sp. AB-CW3]QOC21485.1 nucleotidyltransferase [Wenzhouxiangella sp. AB-CW3]
MKLSTIQTICRALNEAGVNYLVVGGVAVNSYGYIRATQDLDLVVALSEDNARAAMETLTSLGYKPRVPVQAEEFVDPDKRRRWIKEKGMTVFSMFNDNWPETTVDVFVDEPFDFDTEHESAEIHPIGAGVDVPFISIESLIDMKEQVGRDRDRDDVTHLRWILQERGAGEKE